MTPTRKKPGVAFWATVVVVVGLAYPLSFGHSGRGNWSPLHNATSALKLPVTQDARLVHLRFQLPLAAL